MLRSGQVRQTDRQTRTNVTNVKCDKCQISNVTNVKCHKCQPRLKSYVKQDKVNSAHLQDLDTTPMKDRQTDRQKDRQTDRENSKCKDGWMDGRGEKRKMMKLRTQGSRPQDKKAVKAANSRPTNYRMDGREGWVDGRMDGWTDGWMDGWMEGGRFDTGKSILSVCLYPKTEYGPEHLFKSRKGTAIHASPLSPRLLFHHAFSIWQSGVKW